MKAIHGLWLVLFCAVAFAQQGDAPPVATESLADRLLAAYGKLDSYCDRCRVFNLDASTLHSYEAFRWPGKSSEAYGAYPARTVHRALAEQVLSWYLTPVDAAAVRERLAAWRPQPGLSTPELEAWGVATPLGADTLWISRQDGLIRRADFLASQGMRYELDEVRVNQPVSAGELSHSVPLGSSLERAVKQHGIGASLLACVLSFLAGLACWKVRARVRGNAPRWGNSRVFGMALLVSAIPVALMVARGLGGSGMEGAAASLQSLLYLVVYAGALLLVALFLAARSIVDPAPRKPE